MKDNVFRIGICPWYPRNWIKNIIQFFRNCKFAWQRATKGYSDIDVWNLDSFYLELFANSIKELADSTISMPSKFYNPHKEDEGHKDWIDYLLKMAKHFENAQNGYKNKYSYDDKRWINEDLRIEKFKEDEFNKGWAMLYDVFFDLWD